jgi:2'-5' RNA ligase
MENPTGMMLALFPNPEAAESLAHPDHVRTPSYGDQPGWLPPIELHMTLVYAGNGTAQNPQFVEDLRNEANKLAKFIRNPINTQVTGSLVFPTPSSGLTPLCRAVQLDAALKKLIYFLDYGRFSASQFGFVPHMTIGYTRDTPQLDHNVTVPVRFDSITLCVGDSQQEFPFATQGENQ